MLELWHAHLLYTLYSIIDWDNIDPRSGNQNAPPLPLWRRMLIRVRAKRVGALLVLLVLALRLRAIFVYYRK